MFRRYSCLAGLAVLCGVWATQTAAATFQEDFTQPPGGRGWRVFGDAALFAWDPVAGNLAVTWDSSRTNSYFYHELGTVLGRDDDFSVAFDLRLKDIQAGPNPAKPYAFQIAISLLSLKSATQPSFLRGTGVNASNLVEFTYFPDAGFGATIWPICISSNGIFNYNGSSDYTLAGLTAGDLYHVVMSYEASGQVIKTTLTRNGQPAGPINDVPLSPSFTDFRVDAFSVSSYSDEGDSWDSVLAHGTIDNVAITTPPPPVSQISQVFIDGAWQVRFASTTNWVYTLERSVDYISWGPVSTPTSGTGAELMLRDLNPPPGQAFYRVAAQRP